MSSKKKKKPTGGDKVIKAAWNVIGNTALALAAIYFIWSTVSPFLRK
ncbi:hypothetical protein [Lacticaseibacillus saniviri]|nr:hypothetical protein [Lacticaseibacillus saniviri]